MEDLNMVTVNVEGWGQGQAGVAMMAEFDGLSKKELVAKIAGWTKDESGKGVAFWRALPKETLVVVAADMFASDVARKADAEEARDATSDDIAIEADEAGKVTDELTGPETPDYERLSVAQMHGEAAEAEAEAQTAPRKIGLSSKTPPKGDARPLGTPAVKFVEQSQDTRPAPLKLEGRMMGSVGDDMRDEHKPANGKPTVFVLKCTVLDGYLRRDQPRKPGDKPTWKRVETLDKAFKLKSLRQAQAKLFEVAELYDDRDHQCEIVEVEA